MYFSNPLQMKSLSVNNTNICSLSDNLADKLFVLSDKSVAPSAENFGFYGAKWCILRVFQ